MGPELHYELILNRVSELHEAAAAHRRAKEADKRRKSSEGTRGSRNRSLFAKLRTS
ncbi:hypothetical protein [Spongiactinospora sp. TRM90649]|uniref:hypothetical protein n=1 Tax=Spongiactinospora sp. TRM90649 TaxID=3031114 RepID=UPI0023F835A7|nr:hypothetical protein [Spongiactinospora sp. TRM90649]MDF5751906.1 hypothetical protein [Spongiactinospora sp. TRM90649]